MTSPAQKTTRDLRWHNRSDLLTRLYLGECASRNELARASGLSPATVSNVVSDLIGDGLVAENGSQSSAGGRPTALLRVRPEAGHVVGVDIAETEIRVGLFDWTLRLVAEEVRPVGAAWLAPRAVADQVLAEVAAVTAQAGIGAETLLGVGVGVPGAVRGGSAWPGPTVVSLPGGSQGSMTRGSMTQDSMTQGGQSGAPGRARLGDADGSSGSVVQAPTLGWSAVPLAGMLAAGLGFAVEVDNGAMALGQAETWRGAARGAERAVTLLLGIGAGGALSMAAGPGGRARSFTLEWGHTVVDLVGPACRCGARGCLETYVGAEAIVDRYLAMPGSRSLATDRADRRLAELVERGTVEREPAAAAALSQTATYLGVGISNLINLVSPDRVILAGWAGALLSPVLLPGIRATVEQHVLPYLRGSARIEPGALGPSATALGAATLPVARLLADGGIRAAAGSNTRRIEHP